MYVYVLRDYEIEKHKKKSYYFRHCKDEELLTRGASCLVWKRFANLFETLQSLFWAAFGLISLSDFETCLQKS